MTEEIHNERSVSNQWKYYSKCKCTPIELSIYTTIIAIRVKSLKMFTDTRDTVEKLNMTGECTVCVSM